MRYDLNLLRAFDALYKEQNVTRAAESISISQPAMSAILSRLRELFNDPLFIRDKSGISPTEKAIAIHPTIEKSIKDLDNIVEGEQQFDLSTEHRTFEIAANDYFQYIILPPLLERIRKQAPFINIKISAFTQDIASLGMMSSHTDFSFGVLHTKPDNLIVKNAISDELACVVWKNHSTIKQRISLKQFETLQHIIVKPNHQLKTGIAHILKEKSIKRDIACSVIHFHAALGLIENTDYIVTLPKRICQLFAKNNPLKIVRTPKDFGQFTLNLAWHKRYQKDRAHQWLRNQIIECCQSMD